MKRLALGLFVLGLTVGPASVVTAGDNENAGISLHITDAGAKATPNCDGESPSFFDSAGRPAGGRAINDRTNDCGSGQTGSFDVWVLVCNGSDSVGVAGVEFGIEYDSALESGVDVEGWSLCGDLEFRSGPFPESGGGNVITWEPTFNCQVTNSEERHGVEVPRSVIAVAGAFRVSVFGGDQMAIVPRQSSGQLKVADCSAREDDLTNAVKSRAGIAAFCRGRSYNYCRRGVLAGTVETTWGAVKALYGG
jgi:hypothetical protein